jgi:hypothetical protein
MEFKVGLEADFYGVDCNSFKLDNCVFEAVEDESDGYRSMMSEVRMQDCTDNLIFFKTPIARVRVEDESEGSYDHRGFDGYKLVDVKDGHVWLLFGTDDPTDYYPSFTFYYQTKGEVVLGILES